MYNFPFFPHFYPRPYYSYPQNANMNINNDFIKNKKSSQNAHVRNKVEPHNNNSHHYKNRESNSHNNIIETNFNNELNNDNDGEFIEILGIKLHQDDILLICLIFFLYQEGVKDEFLFIVLILLLLS